MQLASFLEDPQYQDQHSLHMEIIRTFGRVGPNAEPRFRDECTYRRTAASDFSISSFVDSLIASLQSCCHTCTSWPSPTTARRWRTRGSTSPRSCLRPTAPSPAAVSFYSISLLALKLIQFFCCFFSRNKPNLHFQSIYQKPASKLAPVWGQLCCWWVMSHPEGQMYSRSAVCVCVLECVRVCLLAGQACHLAGGERENEPPPFLGF